MEMSGYELIKGSPPVMGVTGKGVSRDPYDIWLVHIVILIV